MTSFYVTWRCAHCNRLVTRFRFTCQCTFNSRHLWLGKAKYPISQIFNNKKGEKSIIGVTCARATSITRWRRSILFSLHHLSSPFLPFSPLFHLSSFCLPFPPFLLYPLSFLSASTQIPHLFCFLLLYAPFITMHSGYHNPRSNWLPLFSLFMFLSLLCPSHLLHFPQT